MIKHIVLLNPKEDVSRTEIVIALDNVQALRQSIPDIIDIQVGKNLNVVNNQGYTYGFIIQFANEKIYKEYASYPAYQMVRKELQRLSQSIITFDIGFRMVFDDSGPGRLPDW
jgi:hypothetical protein